MLSLSGAYAYFCDENGLKRIDASAEEVLRNLDAMAMALLEMRSAELCKIAERCEHCGGSGRRKSADVGEVAHG